MQRWSESEVHYRVEGVDRALMDEHNDRFTEEHAQPLANPSEQEWQRQRWLSFYGGPHITVEGLCELPPSMHYVCDPAHDTGGAWTLELCDVPHQTSAEEGVHIPVILVTDGGQLPRW